MPASGFLTEQQATAVADVITEWSVLEIGLQKALCELAQAPMALGQALTEDLGPDNRIKALKRLAQTWQSQSSISDDHRTALAECLTLATWITKVKARRNQIAHWIWIRANDTEMFGFKYSTRPFDTYGDPKGRPQTSITETVEGLTEFAGQINYAAERFHRASEALETLPTWPRRYVAADQKPERPERSGQSEPPPPPPTSSE